MRTPARVINTLLSASFLAGLLVPLSGAAGEGNYPDYTLSGSFKSLLSVGKTPVEQASFGSGLNRLKLEAIARFSDVVSARLVVDNEFLLGSIIDTDEFQFSKELDSNTRWDLDTLVVDNEDLVWRASVYRAHIKLAFAKANVIAGRQRIAWGTGRVWNPTDLFNPISPLQIERAQRDGIDGLSGEYFVGDLSSVNVVYAAGAESDQDSLAVRAGTNIQGFDVGLMGGEFREDSVVGVDFGGNLGAAGFRGEATYTNPESGDSFSRVVLSLDYSWPNTLYLLLEYLHNGGNLAGSGIPDQVIEARQRYFSGEIITRNKNFVATGIGYELNPLLRVDGLAIYDIEDSSFYISPTLAYNVLQNVDLTLGVQLFTGDAGSEYGDKDNLYYASFKVFF